jgi:formylglycine-generating enzyme required for sulfatase activity
MRLLRVDPGSFLRGANKDELGRRPNELAQENAAVTKPFYLGIYEVTQAQYLALMPRNPSYWRNNPTWPVDQVDWSMITGSSGFLARLNAVLGTKHGSLFVAGLPAQDEWEYACRAGTQTAFNNGKNITNAYSDTALDQLANYNRASNGSPRPVGSFQPNAWGFYDMHGNVAEWCEDRYIRGGSWQAKAANCRVSWRTQISAEAVGSNQNGFRLALHLKDKDAK